MTWANRITIGRILVVPVFLGALLYYAKTNPPDERLRYLAFGLFLFAAISDGVDGYLARHWNQKTRLGTILDPLADKLLVFTALVGLSVIHYQNLASFPLWFPVLVVSRDVFLTLGALTLHYLHHPVEVRPHWTGKVSTVFVFAAICAALLKLSCMPLLCDVGGLFTFISAGFYLRDGLRLMETDLPKP